MADPANSLAWISPDEDPTWHAALEEAALRKSTADFLLLWVSPPSLHVGKNQNLWSQVPAGPVYRDKIPVYRRLSGGGTVYHDRGNLNFSLISTGEPRIDFCKHLGTILPFFERRGIPAEIRNRSDLFCGEEKFSGNAEYFSGGRILHHGTLLFDTDLAAMRRYLTRGTGPYEDRAIDSNRSKTRNLKPLLPDIETLQDFATALVDDLREREPRWRTVSGLPGELMEEARRLQPGYRKLEWILGRSPAYELERSHGGIRCRLSVKRGLITRSETRWPDHPDGARVIDEALPGTFHAPRQIRDALTAAGADARLTCDDFWLDLFF